MRSSLPSDDDKLEARRELMEEITEEQRQRAAANRIAAIAKRKAQDHGSWALFKCNKTSHQSTANKLAEKFCVRLEICSPDSFSLTPHPAKGFPYPGEDQCFRRLTLFLSNVMPSHYTQNHGGGKACVYKLGDYEAVSRCLKSFKSIEIEDVPFATLNVIERLSRCFAAGRWMPCRPEHFSDEKVEELMGRLPKTLLDALLPFQLDGIRYGLQRGGRCLIADEMGLGKTLQGIAIACCFMNEGSILVVCPAILRYSWAEELERWLPICLPADIHLVFGRRDNPAHLKRRPRVVVISYTMLCRLRKSMLEQEWALLIVDESHHVRTSKTSESEEIKAVLDVATKIKHIVLLSGTPSLSRPFDIFHQINMLWPGLLGKTKYEFAKTYCDVQQRNGHGNVFQDFSKGTRLEELNVLLKRTVMIRRLKENVLQELPPKRRQIIRLLLKRSDIVSAKAVAVGMKNAAQDTLETLDEPEYEECGACISSEKLSHQELGIAKLSGFREWISLHPLIALRDGAEELDLNSRSHKMIIFAHHLKVLDGVQEFLCEKEICFVRIDGNTLARDRQSAVQSFQSSSEVKIAIIGITAGGVGLDFSSAQHVVFLELPQSPSLMLQAEDRAHRRGQTNAVNIYIFCAKDTMDESHWTNLNKSLRCVSSATNGKYDSVQEIAVEGVSYLKTSGEIQKSCELSGGSTWLVHTGLGSSMQSFQLHNELTEKGNDISELGSKNGSLETKLGRIYEDLEVNSGRMSSNEQDIGSEDKDQLERDCNFYTHNREAGDGQLVQPIEADISFSDLANCLRFEVSQYTGRIHLYSCIPGKDSRPTPLFENFRPEEIESGSFPSVSDNQKATSLKDNPTCRHALLTFLKEWNQLRPIEARKLRGKPLQLPLNVELCYLKESSNHNNGGLLNGGSKRRTTPLCEISHSLPSNAVWKEVLIGRSNWKKEKQYTQAWSVIHDEPLCKLCHTPCEGNNARTPEFFEDLFCNLGCYEEYRIRTSNRFLRQELFQIEHGVCTNCQLDCHQLIKHLKPLSLERRLAYIERVAPKLASKKTVLDKLVNDPSGGNAWHADHIVPVYLGGGECRLENMRTLCVVCHSEVTAAQCSERRASRAEAKRRLKAIMTNLRNKEVMETSSKVINEGEGDEDELIVKVPGSAYCGEKSIMGG